MKIKKSIFIKIKILLILLFLLTGCSILKSEIKPTYKTQSVKEYSPGLLIFSLNQIKDFEKFFTYVNETYHLNQISYDTKINIGTISVPNGEENNWIKRLETIQEIDYIELNYIISFK